MFRTLTAATILTAMLLLGCQNDGTPPQPAPLKPSAEARGADPVYAYVDAIRCDLSEGKVQIINQVMKLSPEESKTFWPIYHDYEEELFDLGDRRVELTRNFVNAQTAQKLDNDSASKIADGWFQFESDRLSLLQKYHKIIAKEISPIRAAQFTQIEHRVGTVIDLVIASEAPLIDAKAAR